MSRGIVIALLLAAAVAVTIQNVLFFRSSAPDASETSEGETGEESDTAGAADETPQRHVSRERLLAYLESLSGRPARNPFLTRAEAIALSSRERAGAPGDGGAGASMPVLSGTLWSEARRIAWLEGVPRRERESVGAFEVARIERGAVVLRGEADELRLELASEDAEETDDAR